MGHELGETARDDGFRRVSRVPEPLALARMRAMLLDATVGGTTMVEQGLASFEEWRFLAALCESPWFAGARRASHASRRVLQRRLRLLGTHPIDMTVAAALPAGSAVHLRGTARHMPPSRPDSHIWVVSTISTDNVRRLVEEGHDFFVTDNAGQTACVIAARGHLINDDRLADGDRVSVYGYVDRIADPRAEARSAHARGELSLAVRSGDALPLLVRRLDGEAGTL